MSLINTGCGLAGLRSLKAGSVDLVFCDLPSGETRASFDKPIDLAEFWAAAWPALKPAGVVVLMASSMTYAAAVVASQPKPFRYAVVWEKSKATGFLSANKQPMRAHEYILVFYRKAGTFNPQRTTGHDPIAKSVRRAGDGTGPNYGNAGENRSNAGSTERMPRDVIRFDSPGSHYRRHPQQKPIALLQWVVKTYTNEGELIADPCAGSGSMGVAALGVRREFVGWDFEPRPPSAVDVGLFG